MKKMLKLTAMTLLIGLISSCTVLENLVEEETPTTDRIQGVWEATSVLEIGTDTLDILDTLNLRIPSYIHIKENTHFSSTAGPLFLYLVYGKSKWTQVTSKIDQLFDYAKITTTDGRWFCGPQVVDVFTPEVTLSFPSSQTFKTILDVFGVGNGYLDTYIEHKFKDVSITFEGDDTMYWEWTDMTEGVYNKLNNHGDPILWSGWDATRFSRCRIKFEKRVKTLTTLIDESTN